MTSERLKHVATVTISNVDKKSSDGEIPVRLCNYTDVYYNERITTALDFMPATARAEQVHAFGLAAGDVVLTKDSETADDMGISAYVAETIPGLVCGYHLAIARPRPGRVDGRFLRWALAATPSRQRMASLATGVTRFGLRGDAIADLPVSMHTLPTQRGIADYLDRETARIDRLIAARKRMAELLEDRWSVERDDLVLGRDQGQNGVSGPSWMGRLPFGWTTERLKYLARMDSGHTPDRKIDEFWVGCTIPWITLNDVSRLEGGWEIHESVNLINELGMANSAAHLLPAHTVILSRDATVGRCALLGRPMCVSQHFVGWICGDSLFPEYLLLVLRGPMQRHFATLTAGATIATIGMPELSDLVVPLPPHDEQERIVELLRAREKLYRRSRLIIEQHIVLLREHRQALITAAVAGELEIPEAA